MNYDYFDHDADLGIIGRGDTIEEAFVQAAYAVFANMANLSEIPAQKTVCIEFEEEDSEFALVEWLNALLGQARAAGLIFSTFSLRHEKNRWIGEAAGAPWQASSERGTEVKGATLTMLSVKKQKNYWEARCVVDV